jgi:nitrate/nitrite transport system substrate-binding protein
MAIPPASSTRFRKRLEKPELVLGFIPLTDCAPLIVAQEKGYFARYGLRVRLSRETSWANVRDKVCLGMLDGAHMLAGVPLLSAADPHSTCTPLVTAMSLDLNGNGVTVSHELYGELTETGVGDLDRPAASAQALARVIARRREAGEKALTFATVFPVSSHNYLLRYWMASAGIDPDLDVRLTVVPPPQMVNYLRAGVISGYCVGEPWNAHAVNADLGHTLFTSYDVWNNHPEKVFAVSRPWAEANPNTHQALVMALLEACAWIDEPEHRAEVSALLSQGRYVNAPAEVLGMSLEGTFQFSSRSTPLSRPDFNVFHRYAANFPWHSHAAWMLGQMLRWGQLDGTIDVTAIASRVYRPEIYRQAARALDLPVPAFAEKVEGIHGAPWRLEEASTPIAMGPDLFMDGRRFDPRDIVGYLRALAVHHLRVPLPQLAASNPPRTRLSPAGAM